MGIVSPVPAIAMMKEMDDRGKVVNAAFLVCGASALAAHMGFTFGTEPDLVLPLLLSKLAGGLCGAAAALLLTGQADGSNISFQKGECDNDNYPKITGA